MLTLASEETTTLLPEGDVKAALEIFRDRLANQEFGAYDGSAGIPIFLKHPLSALIIPQICAAFETRLIYLVRRCATSSQAGVGESGAPNTAPRRPELSIRRCSTR